MISKARAHHKETMPEVWKQLLASLQRISSNCILAGGAIRDLLGNKPIKDLDFFMPETIDHSLYLCELGYTLKRNSDYAHTLPGINCIWEHGGRVPMQIMTCNEPIEVVTEGFDIGLCETWFDGRDIFFTRNYLEDAMGKLITTREERLTRTQQQMNYSHVERIVRKYPDYTVVYKKAPPVELKFAPGTVYTWDDTTQVRPFHFPLPPQPQPQPIHRQRGAELRHDMAMMRVHDGRGHFIDIAEEAVAEGHRGRIIETTLIALDAEYG